MLDKTRLQNDLIELGANPFLKGFRCTVEALDLIDEESGKGMKMMYLYEVVGKKTGDKSSNVERAIRHFFSNLRKNSKAVEVIGENGPNSETLYLLYYKLKGEEEQCNMEE